MAMSSRFRYGACTVLAFVLSSTGLSACSGGDDSSPRAGDGKGTIRVWAHQGQAKEVAVLRSIVKSFNSSQGKIKVKLTLIPEKNYTKTITTTRVSALPDVLEFDGPSMANLVQAKKLISIDHYLSIRTLGNATDANRGQGEVANKLYGLGMFDSGLGIYGNKKLLDKAGVKYPIGLSDDWTAAQFTAALRTLSSNDSDRKVLDLQEGSLASEWGTYGFAPIIWSAGGSLLDDGRAGGVLDSPASISALNNLRRWKRYVDSNTDGNALLKGRVALSWAGHWMYPAYKKALGDNLVVLPLPDFGNGPKVSQGSWDWGIGGATKEAKAAGVFLNYLLNDANVTAMATANGAPPGTKTVLYASPLYKEGGPLHLFSDQLSQPCSEIVIDESCIAVRRPVSPEYPSVTAEFSKAVDSVYHGTDAKIALKRAAQAIDQGISDHEPS